MTEVATYTAQIYIAGDYATAKIACQRYCAVGLCVTIEPLEFVYTGGCEAGMRIGLINYPRFPTTPDELFERALDLGRTLRDALAQHSFSVVATDTTVWESTRAEAAAGPWVADFHNERRDGGRFITSVLKPGELVPVAAVPTGVEGFGREEGRANARLIAAAPDLLEALQQLYREDGNAILGMALAGAAIAKATGSDLRLAAATAYAPTPAPSPSAPNPEQAP